MADNIDNHPVSMQMGNVLKMLEFANDESDRGIALITCSSLDNMLRDTLLSFLMDCNTSKGLLDESGGPIGSLFNRARLGYALGIINKTELQEFNLLAEIRNEFAHKVDVSFNDPCIIQLCEKLNFADTEASINGHQLTQSDSSDISKEKFKKASVSLLLIMAARPFLAQCNRLKPIFWSGQEVL